MCLDWVSNLSSTNNGDRAECNLIPSEGRHPYAGLTREAGQLIWFG